MSFVSFRHKHLTQILNIYDREHKKPLDVLISNYFRETTQLGSKDRKEIADTVFNLIRWRGLIDAHSKLNEITWDKRLKIWPRIDFDNIKHFPIHDQLSVPKWLYDEVQKSYGTKQACEIFKISNTNAPVTLRINELKITRDEWMKKWNRGLDTPPTLCSQSPWGVMLQKRESLSSRQDFKLGLFEIQDESSQLLAHQLLDVQPHQKVFDFCAGSGGKTLAIAPKMRGTGLLFLHGRKRMCFDVADIREKSLANAKLRLKRAGIHNYRMVTPETLPKMSFKCMDWVLVDAPCSGTGTLRRNTDTKWKLSPEKIYNLVQEQRDIFKQALQYMKINGKIVYSTCSILPRENEEQVKYFEEVHNLKATGKIFQTLPVLGGMDGFFGVILSKMTERLHYAV